MAEAESEAQRRLRKADPFIIGLTQHALENADTERLADLVEAFLASDDQVMRDAFIMGPVGSCCELTPDDYVAALQRLREQLDDPRLIGRIGRLKQQHREIIDATSAMATLGVGNDVDALSPNGTTTRSPSCCRAGKWPWQVGTTPR